MTDFSIIGRPIPMVDAASKTSGAGKYTDDLSLPGMLTGKILHSPHPHARIRRIDATRAEQLDGVVAVITGADAPNPYGILPVGHDEHALCVDKVRYVGDNVACIAAETEAIAQQALELVDVEYQILPAYFDPEESMKAERDFIHENKPHNLEKDYHHVFGDPQKGFAEAEVVEEARFLANEVTHAAMEPHSTLASFDLDPQTGQLGRLTVWSSTQVPYYLQHKLSLVLDLPMSQIRVIKPLVGGGFGGKSEVIPLEIIAAVAARKAQRPVKITYTREEVFWAHRGRPRTIIDLKTGAKKDGRITAVRARVVQDGGAYCSYGVVTILYSGALLGALYDIPNIQYDGYRVLTNKPACGAMRGHGTVNVRFAFESQLDEIAGKLKMDPGEIRRRNLLKPPCITVNGLRVQSYGLPECIEKVVEASGWRERKGKLPKGHGLGLACSHYVSGAANSIIRSDMPHSTVNLKIDRDGGVVVYTGASEIGQGSDTMTAQIAAEALGCSLSRVKVVAADTDLTPIDIGSYSSRVTFMAGNATLRAAEEVRKQMASAAARKMNCAPGELIFRNDVVYKNGNQSPHPVTKDVTRVGQPTEYNPTVSGRVENQILRGSLQQKRKDDQQPRDFLTFEEAVVAAIDFHGTLTGTGSYAPPAEARGGKHKGAGVGPSPAYSYSAQVAEVSVDEATGQVTVHKVWAAHDCGRALNPVAVEGQVIGSVWMGMGQALTEEMVWKDGLLMNPGLLEYRSPSSVESPEVIPMIVESVDPEGPFGAKECSEGALAATPPAIANAIYDAAGIRLHECPFTPERVLAALRASKNAKPLNLTEGVDPTTPDGFREHGGAVWFNGKGAVRLQPTATGGNGPLGNEGGVGNEGYVVAGLQTRQLPAVFAGTSSSIPPKFQLLRPRSLTDALSMLNHGADKSVRATRLLAGGTDLLPSMRQSLFDPECVIDLRHLAELKGIRETEQGIEIGALTTLREIERSSELRKHYPVLTEAARTVASPVIRNMGTIGGNICLDTRCLWYNQSLAWRKSCGFCIKKDGDLCHVAPGGTKCWAAFSGDTPPALLCLEAEIEIAGPAGTRRIPLGEFYTGEGDSYRKLQPNEIVTRILLPRRSAGLRGAYRKLRIRGSIDYPLAGVAIACGRTNGQVHDLRIGITAVNPAPVLVKGIVDVLNGGTANHSLPERIGELAARTAKPLTTSALTPEYRREMIRVFTQRALADMLRN
ncbi:MAG TPA: molybdopterin cofactor-binding domain-containing protein [Terriglobales bacterium]